MSASVSCVPFYLPRKKAKKEEMAENIKVKKEKAAENTCVIVLLHFDLLFWKRHGFEVKRRERLPSNTFPFLSAKKEHCQNETAQIGTKTARNGAETAQNFGDHQTCMFVSKMAKY